MKQNQAWDKEYKKPVLVTKHDQPQKDTLRFFKYLKNQSFSLNKAKILDLGSGSGRNSIYLSWNGATVTGMETSAEAVKIAKTRAAERGVPPNFLQQSIGSKYPFADAEFDIILDVLTSHLLDDQERGIYLSEISRVLKPGGYFYIKTLLKDGDINAHNLLKNSPGEEKDTYILPELEVQERVFSEKDFREIFTKDFEIIRLLKKTSLIPFKNQIYKRRFLVAYLQKK